MPDQRLQESLARGEKDDGNKRDREKQHQEEIDHTARQRRAFCLGSTRFDRLFELALLRRWRGSSGFGIGAQGDRRGIGHGDFLARPALIDIVTQLISCGIRHEYLK